MSAVFERGHANATPSRTRKPLQRKIGAAIALFFLLALSLRLVVIAFYGLDLPFWDQWDAMAWGLFRPFERGELQWGTIFGPHAEHRIALTRLYSLALYVLNDHQFDNLVEATINTIVYAAALTLCLRTLARHDRLAASLIAFPLLLALAVPSGHENLLIGFQSQFYFLPLLAICGVWAAVRCAPTMGSAFGLGILAFASLFATASGLFAPIVMAIALVLRQRAERLRWLSIAPALAMLSCATIAGILLMVKAPPHESLHAAGLHDIVRAGAACFSYPLPPPYGLVLWLPVAYGAYRIVRTRSADPLAIAAVALAAWVCAQAMTIVYGRGHVIGSGVAPRYKDLMVYGVLVGSYFVAWLLQQRMPERLRRAKAPFAAAWMFLVVAGFALQARGSVGEIRNFSALRQSEVENVRHYLATRDPGALQDKPTFAIPLPDADRLQAMLDDAAVLDMLPVSVRRPLALDAEPLGPFRRDAIPPALPRLPGAEIYGNFPPAAAPGGGAELRSGPLHSRFPFVELQAAANSTDRASSLRLDARGSSEHVEMLPAKLAPDAWTTTVAATPAADFELRAGAGPHDAWFAFTAPVELGRLSRLVALLLRCAPLLLTLALLMTLLLGAAWCWQIVASRNAQSLPVRA